MYHNSTLALGPAGEAKLIQTGISLPSVSAVQHKVAIACTGCYPAYSQLSQEQFYWAEVIIQVNQGEKVMIEVKSTNSQISKYVS